MKMFVRLLLLAIIFLIFDQSANGQKRDVFSSVKHMEMLLSVEKLLANNLEKYVNNEKNRLKLLKRNLESIQNGGKQRLVEETIGNPLSALQLIRRMTRNTRQINKSTRRDLTANFIATVNEIKHNFPTYEDFEGAQEALLRLQTTYKLSASQMTSGLTTTAPYFTQMSTQDSYQLGRKAFLSNDFKTTVVWMNEVLRLANIKSPPSISSKEKFDVMDHLAWSLYMTGDVKQALNITTALHYLDPSSQRIASNKAIFEKVNQKKSSESQPIVEPIEEDTSNNTKTYKYEKFKKEDYDDDFNNHLYIVEKETARSLCRGETEPIPQWMMPKLVCWYRTDHPIFILKPAKTERIYHKPDILFYRDAVSDNDISSIKQLATPMLSRATVHNPLTGELESASYRISKSAWLEDSHSPVVASLSRRIEAFTGLSLDTAEMLQVANYGIGGHYDTHFDFSRLKKTKRSNLLKENGNRIATFLTYMSNVEMGGATVFTNIGMRVTPSKGDAIFWYNLKPDGSGDYDTRHAACPVLIGNKWIANKWIHEIGQEFRRQCNLHPD